MVDRTSRNYKPNQAQHMQLARRAFSVLTDSNELSKRSKDPGMKSATADRGAEIELSVYHDRIVSTGVLTVKAYIGIVRECQEIETSRNLP